MMMSRNRKEDSTRSRGTPSQGNASEVSLMETEPMDFDEEGSSTEDEADESVAKTSEGRQDVSYLDTESMAVEESESASEDQDVEDHEEEDSSSGSDSSESGEGDENVRNSQSGAASFVGSEFQFPESDDDVLQDSAVDLLRAPSHEVKRIVTDLINDCRVLEDNLHTRDSEKMLEQSISTSKMVFRQMNSSLSQSLSESHNRGRNRSMTPRGNSASEMLLACVHTKVCSGMLKQKVKVAGVKASPFKLEEFLSALQARSLDEEEGYSVPVLIENLDKVFSNVAFTAPQFQTVFGTFDKDDFAKRAEPPVPKEVKARERRRREDGEDDANVTQSEVVNEKRDAANEGGSDTPEGLARDIVKIVKTGFRETGAPLNILDVAKAQDLPEMVRRLFGVAFVVRDGFVGLDVADECDEFERHVGLMLRPEKPPQRVDVTDDGQHRLQTIASFSAPLLKMLVAKRNQRKS